MNETPNTAQSQPSAVVSQKTVLEKLQETIQPFQNTLVLYGFAMYRLVEVVDGDYYYYYVLDDGKQEIWASCVGEVIRLKGVLPNQQYNRLVIVWNQNASQRAD